MKTDLLYSVINTNVELSTQFGADTKGINSTWQGRFLCRENKIYNDLKV